MPPHILRRYDMPLREAKQLAQRTLRRLDDLSMPPNPAHYTLLFEYLGQLDPFLIEQLEPTFQLHAYSPEAAEEIYLALLRHLLNQHLPIAETETQLAQFQQQTEQCLNRFAAHCQALKTDAERLRAERPDDCEVALDALFADILPRVDALTAEAERFTRHLDQFIARFEKLRHQFSLSQLEARTDPLTGLLNRRGMMERLDTLIQTSAKNRRPFGVIILDVDRFKQINDRFGHIVGDSVLRYLARLLRNETKGQDILARLGGEEFAVVLPNTGKTGVFQVAVNLVEKVSQKVFSVRLDNRKLRFTVSAGTALYQPGETLESLFARADAALYRAKNDGRNCVRSADDDMNDGRHST